MIYLYVLLLRIVAYLEGVPKFISFAITLALISYSTLKRIPTVKLDKITQHNVYGLFLFIVIIVHGLIFGNFFFRDFAVLLTYWIWFIFTYNYFKSTGLRQGLKYMLITFLIFNLGNFLFYKISFADQKYGINSILSIFNIYSYRIYFPLSTGANIFASQLALNSVLSIYFLKTSKNKLVYFLIYAFYLYMLVIADSRLILFFALSFSVIYWFSFRVVLEFFKKFWWVFIILLIVFLYIFYGTDIFNSFKRAGEIDGRALSRIKIWSLAGSIIFEDFHLITGYGINGFEYNMPEELRNVFKVQYLQTSHNFFIQNIIDFGLIGLVIALYLVYFTLLKTQKIKSQIVTVLMIMILFMGITESIPTFYSTETTFFYLSLLSLILTNEGKAARST
jgi:hypothetical protein